jgi:hypothetical protein
MPVIAEYEYSSTHHATTHPAVAFLSRTAQPAKPSALTITRMTAATRRTAAQQRQLGMILKHTRSFCRSGCGTAGAVRRRRRTARAAGDGDIEVR